MTALKQLIDAAFHTVESDLTADRRFEGDEYIENFKSGAGIVHYRHDALMGEGYPLYLLYNPSSDSCLLAYTPTPNRPKHYLEEKREEIKSVERALEMISGFFERNGKKVIEYKY